MTIKTKTCSCCGEEYPATTDYFHKNSTNKKYGLQSRCKECNGSDLNAEYHLRQGAVVYQLTCLKTGDTYIGSTTKSLNHRISNHFTSYDGDSAKETLIRMFPDRNDWSWSVLYHMDPKTTTFSDLREAEQAYIEQLHPSLNTNAAAKEVA